MDREPVGRSRRVRLLSGSVQSIRYGASGEVTEKDLCAVADTGIRTG